ncbi:MAG: hypothetical protein RL745_34 [Actinomycetota bacterium]
MKGFLPVLPFILKRLGYMMLILVLASFAVYIIFSLLPFDPAALTCGKSCSPEIIEANRRRLGYDQPLLVQYWHFIQGLWAGRNYGQGAAEFTCPAPSMGYSFRTKQCVTEKIVGAFPTTFGLAVGALSIYLTLGIALGVMAARKKGRWQDRSATVFVLLATSLPSFFVGLMLLFTFSVKLGWFPNSLTDLAFPIFYEDPVGWMQRMFLPWMTLALVSAAIYTRYSRAQVLEIGSEDFVRTARAKGLPERVVMRKHILRAALAPLVTLAALDFAGLLGGAVFTESIFGLPGIGRMAINSVNNIDLPIITALTLIAAAIVIVANMVVDILYAVLDPRVRSV